MRETRPSGSEGGVRQPPHPYPYRPFRMECGRVRHSSGRRKNWIPAFAGMTEMSLNRRKCFRAAQFRCRTLLGSSRSISRWPSPACASPRRPTHCSKTLTSNGAGSPRDAATRHDRRRPPAGGRKRARICSGDRPDRACFDRAPVVAVSLEAISQQSIEWDEGHGKFDEAIEAG